jgi:hypothetical protein
MSFHDYIAPAAALPLSRSMLERLFRTDAELRRFLAKTEKPKLEAAKRLRRSP